ncbi:MFS general substrate transporter [Hortaea werneckii]|nr:MFS general substrate transporter [Hortaea werneckii]KAI7075458.1 MFS general substrate transporter [Hortaea werneckii]KAI7303882.1 MFS general substrate transporter [Hortaea werneckii]KAI7387282.1 MFS general substrate transporter [Hortaea werneckii]
MSAIAQAHRERRLPKQQLAILAICRFAEPLASTSLFPYLPEMIRSFSIPESEVGKWAGLAAAMFSLCQACMGIPWGRFSDIYGRKTAILLGLTSTMFTSLLWGFSTSLPMAIVARSLAGAGNGNVGIIRTVVAEMVPFKELQPRAFSIMPLVWNVGSIFGPTIGGALANPLDVKPGDVIEDPSLFQRFPYALPNLVSACFFAIGITNGLLFLEETLETKKGKRDYGRVVGEKITGLVKSHVVKVEEILHLRSSSSSSAREETETEPLLKPQDDEEAAPNDEPAKSTSPPPGLKEIMTPQSALNLLVYFGLAMHTMAFDQLLPVYMSYPSINTGSPSDITPPSPDSSPLKFAGGFSLDHFRIGLISTCYGICGMLIQFFIFPPVARRLGVLYCLKWCACVFPLAYFIMPFTALLPTQETQIGVGFAVMMLKCVCGIFAYPCSTILITNSASSLRVLGTLNGFATSVAAIGRAAGPALGGSVFSYGVKRGFVIAPWWAMALVAVLAAIPVFWLREGEGFGGDEGDSDDEEERDGGGTDAMDGGVQGGGKSGSAKGPPDQHPQENEDEANDEVGGLLIRTNTASSAGIADAGSASGLAPGSRRGSQSQMLSRKNSRGMRPMPQMAPSPLSSVAHIEQKPPGQQRPYPNPDKTGRIPFSYPKTGLQGETYYLQWGSLDSDKTPLICLHGGPGAAHNYLLPISLIWKDYGIPVIMYDQIGCGKSTHFSDKKGDKDFWTPELFMAELDNLKDHLGIQQFHLLGQSWGGMLGGQYAIDRQPTGLRKLIISDSPSDMVQWVEVANRLRKDLPKDVRETLDRCEREGRTDSEEYEEAVNYFYSLHVCRITPFPQELVDSFANIKEDGTVYETMNGPSEFYVIGTLKHWSISEGLKKITAKTAPGGMLIINGYFDEAQDETCVAFFQNPSCRTKWVRYALSSHMPMLEETEAYVRDVGTFLTSE